MTIDAYGEEDPKTTERKLLARVESIAMTTGEVLVYHDDGLEVAKAIGEMLEEHYVKEAVICKREAPQ